MTGDRAIPPAPLALGLAGLLPFWGLALGMGTAPAWLPTTSTLGAALALYGAVIVSFLGGIRWGMATLRPDQTTVASQYAVAVVPSLLAWSTFALPLQATLLTLGIVALVLGVVDQRLVSRGIAPVWFGRLRMILSGGAGAALLLASATLSLRV